MRSLRSILWVGRGRHFAADLASRAPLLDIVWECDAGGAAALALERFEAVVLDAESAAQGLEGLRSLRAREGAPPVLVRIAEGELGERALWLSAGAADVLARPAEPEGAQGEELLLRLDALAARAPDRAPAPREPRPRPAPSLPGIVGASAAMQEVLGLVACAARTSASVLLAGETGTGKELLARALHQGSARQRGPFVAVNCAALPETLLESELFGYRRGAFTGADRDKPGLFEEAHGGTLFLDEVGETPPLLQAKLLRALQEREVRPLGCTRSRPVDVRLVTASNRDLWREAARGGFRLDLYYRLAVFPIRVPPLRERLADVLPLAAHFLAELARRDGEAPAALSEQAAQLLLAHPWPGNVRELANEVERARALAGPRAELLPAHFSERLREGAPAALEAGVEPGESLREALDRVEAWLIRRALAAHQGRRAETARRLRLTREGLYKKMKRLGIG
jgi:two-component system NtrC family response regulator